MFTWLPQLNAHHTDTQTHPPHRFLPAAPDQPEGRGGPQPVCVPGECVFPACASQFEVSCAVFAMQITSLLKSKRQMLTAAASFSPPCDHQLLEVPFKTCTLLLLLTPSQAFKTLLAPGIELKDHDKTDLNVSVLLP